MDMGTDQNIMDLNSIRQNLTTALHRMDMDLAFMKRDMGTVTVGNSYERPLNKNNIKIKERSKI